MPDVIEPAIRALAVVIAVIALYRINGLRSFSKMSGFDFALTVATGSLLAGTIQNGTLTGGLIALASVFTIQFIISRLRQTYRWAQLLTNNDPLLLAKDGRILHDHLKAARITEDDLYAKLRETNTFSLSDVRAVVLETTGNISVLHASDAGQRLDPDILRGVRRTL